MRPLRHTSLLCTTGWLVLALPALAQSGQTTTQLPPQGSAVSETVKAECFPALDPNQPASLALTDLCHEPATTALVQQLLARQRKNDQAQSLRFPRLAGLENQNDHLRWQVMELTRAIRTLGRTPNDPKPLQALMDLANDKPDTAATWLGQLAANTPALMYQQAALLRTYNPAEALGILTQATQAKDSDLFALRTAASWAELLGQRERAITLHQRVGVILRALLARFPDNVKLLYPVTLNFNAIATLQRDLNQDSAALENLNAQIAPLKKLIVQEPAEPVWRQQLASVYNQIGNIQVGLGQVQAALENYQLSLPLRQQLALAAPNNLAAQHDWFVSQLNLAGELAASGRHREALEHLAPAEQLIRQLLQKQPDNLAWQRHLASCLSHAAESQSLTGDHQKAAQLRQQALDILSKLTSTAPEDATLQRDLALSYSYLGEELRLLGQADQALANFLQASNIDRKLVASDASNHVWQRDLAANFRNIGVVQHGQEKTAEALANILIEVQLRQRLANKAPDNVLWQREWAGSTEMLGDLYTIQGQVQAALAQYQQTVAIRQKLLDGPLAGEAFMQRALAVSLSKTSNAHGKLGQAEASIDTGVRELALRQALAKAAGGSLETQQEVILSLLYVGDLELRRNQLEAAQRHFQASLDLINQINLPQSPVWQSGLASTHIKLGKVRQAERKLDLALVHFQKALDIHRSLAGTDPANRAIQNEMAVDLAFVGLAQFGLNQLPPAMKSYQNALSIMVKLTNADPKNQRWQNDLIGLYLRIGDTFSAQGNHIDALANYNAALLLQQKVSAQAQGDPEAQSDLMNNYQRIGEMQIRLGYADAALESFDTALTLLNAIRQRDHNAGRWDHTRAVLYMRLGETQTELERYDQAEASLQTALSGIDALAKARPEDLIEQLNVASIHASMATLDEARNAPANAMKHYQLARDITGQLMKKDPANTHFQIYDISYNGRMALLPGNLLDSATKTQILKDSVARLRQIQSRTPLPTWATFRLSQFEKTLTGPPATEPGATPAQQPPPATAPDTPVPK